ncbi:MAG: helix-turn-helix transcriptional regulator [Gemmatimonadota bacterium]
MGRHSMGEFEHLVVLAALRIGRDAYGASIIEEIEERTGRDVSQAAAYLTLKRLEAKGWLEGRQEEGDEERGHRDRRCFTVTEEGRRRLERSRAELASMWEGLAPEPGR